MEKSTEAEALRVEYLELLKIMYGTCLTGIERAKACLVGTGIGGIVIRSHLINTLSVTTIFT
jgi:hypothetical protein